MSRHFSRVRAYFWSDWLRRFGVVLAVLLVLYLGLEALGVSETLSPGQWARKPDGLTAAISFVLLVLDVVLPVPSSLVMVANGALFGLAAGALLSTSGALASALLGFGLGRRLPRTASTEDPEALARAEALLDRWGMAAVILSRPLPLLAEAVALVAGAMRLDCGRFLLGSLLGSLPVALVYAAVGASVLRGEALLPLLVVYPAVALAAFAVDLDLQRRARITRRRGTGSRASRSPSAPPAASDAGRTFR
ncbi:MAG: VTT domain-containing protein [Armatimonadota bacterium]